MIRSDSPPVGTALPMDSIKKQFKAWGLPFVLRPYYALYQETKDCKRTPAGPIDLAVVNPFVVDCGDNTGDAGRRPAPLGR